MSEKNYVVNIKNKQGTIFTFRGDTATELNDNINGFIEVGGEFGVAHLEGILLGMSSVAPVAPVVGVQSPAPSAVDIVQDALGSMEVTETPVTQSFAPIPPPSTGGETVDTVEDRWGNKWTYGRADAPVCPNGPMVLKKGTNQAGKSYVGWFDPAGGPRWQGAKIPSDQQTPPKFGVKV
jgi:hypothetical protein